MHSTFALQSISLIQSTPSILHSTNSAVWYLHTVSFNHYNLLYTTILFYSCVLFHLHSLVSHKQLPSCLHSSIKAHSVLPMRSIPSIQFLPHKNCQFLVYTQQHTRILFWHAFNFRFAVYFTNTVDSIYTAFYKQCSLILTYSQCQSLQLASHTHSVLLMRSIPSIQFLPHKNCQFLVYTQLHTRILFCPCVNFRIAYTAYSRLHLYCQTVQSDTYIQSVSIITTCYTQPFWCTHAFYSI